MEKLPILSFEPILKRAIWGTELWTISGVRGDVTGNLSALVAEHKASLVGHHVYARYGNEFPLLVKFIDAKADLSIQVHPDDAMAARKGLPCGKSEMWYVMKSSSDAHLLVGLKEKISPEEYAAKVADDSIAEAIRRYEVKAGDCFFVPAGRIHSIGSGTYLAEIQQPSTTTYRIYDYGRLGTDGQPRQLHTSEAQEAIDYTVLDDYQTHYIVGSGVVPDRHVTPLIDCRFFTVARYDVQGISTLDTSMIDSFVILVGIDGEALVREGTADSKATNNSTMLKSGTSLLVPAAMDSITFEGHATLLLAHV